MVTRRTGTSLTPFPSRAPLPTSSSVNIQALLDLIRRAEQARAARTAEASITANQTLNQPSPLRVSSPTGVPTPRDFLPSGPLAQQTRQDAALARLSGQRPTNQLGLPPALGIEGGTLFNQTGPSAPPPPRQGLLQGILPVLGDLLPQKIGGALPFSRQGPSAGDLLGRVGSVFDASTAAFSALPESVQRGAARLGGGVGTEFIPGVVPSEEVRSRARAQFTPGSITGERQGAGDIIGGLAASQQARSLTEQITSSLFADPLGGALNFVGPGAVVARGAGDVLATAAPAVRSTIKLPPLTDVVSRLRADQIGPRVPGASQNILSKTLDRGRDILAPNTLMDLSDSGPGVINQAVAWMDYGQTVIPESVQVNLQSIMATAGHPSVIFDINPETSLSRVPGFVDLTFNEIYENIWAIDPLNPRITDQMRRFFTKVDRQIEELMFDAREAGVAMDFLDESTTSGHFPRIFEMMNDIKIRQQGLQGFGGEPFYEKARIYEFIEDALSAQTAGGTVTNVYKVGADPLEDLGMLYGSIYKRIVDHQTIQAVSKYGLTINQRIEPKILDAVIDAQTKLDGTRLAADFIRTFDVVSQAPKPGRRFLGKGPATNGAPDLMARLDEIGTIRTKKARQTAFMELRGDMAERLRVQKANLANAKKVKAGARVAAKAKPGEVQFPFTGLGGKIFSPEEMRSILSPDSVVNDFSTLPRESIEKFQAALRPQQKGWLDAAQNISAMSRTLMTGFDLGVGAIHLAPLLVTRPTIWAAAMKTSLDAAIQPEVYARFIEDHKATVQKLIAGNQWHGAGAEHVESLGKAGLLFRGAGAAPELAGRLTGTVGGVAVGKAAGKGAQRVLTGFEAQFNSALSAAKIFMYEALEPGAIASGSPNALNDLMSFIAKSTGTISMANMGTSPTVRKALGALIMFAPRYRMAVYGLIADAFKGGIKGGMARDQFGKMMIGGLLMYSAIGMRLKQAPNLDPRSSKFLTYNVGGTNVGIGSAFTSVTRFVIGGGEQMITAPDTFFRIDRRDSALARQLRGQLSPTLSVATSLGTGQNYMGDRTTGSWPNFFSNVLVPSLTPFYLSALIDGAGIQGAAGEFGGARAFPVSNYQSAVDKADTIMYAETGKRWRDVPGLVRTRFLNDHPDIQREMDKGNEVFAARGVDLAVYREELHDYDAKTYRPALDALAEKIQIFLKRDDLAEQFNVGQTLRQEYKDIKTKFRQKYDDLEEEFPDVVRALKEESPNPDVNIADLAYFRYISEVLAADFEEVDAATGLLTGNFKFQAYDEAVQRFQRSVTPDIWSYIQERRAAGKNLPRELQELVDGQTALASYWDVQVSIIEAFGQRDPTIDVADLKRQYRNYRDVDPETKRILGEGNPLLRQIENIESDAKARHRETNVDKDAWLFRWGYGGLLKHPDNMLRDRVELRGTPVYFSVGAGNVR